MIPSKPLLYHILFLAIRFFPPLAAIAFIDLSNVPFDRMALFLDRFIRALATLVVWNMSEGVFMLWVREKNAGSSKSRGYGIVAIILGLLVLVVLQAFRAQATQFQFMLLLAALALRGMSRGSWEQGRPHIAAITTPIAHALLACFSFTLILGSFSWQSAALGAAIGLLTAAVETTWHAASFQGDCPKWLPPLYRLSIVFPIIAVASLSVIGQLPRSYSILLVLLPWYTRYTWNQGQSGEISDKRFLRIAVMYLAFVAILIGARMYP